MVTKIIERLCTIKSIVTIILTLVFAFLALRGIIAGKDFLSVFLIVVGFYFGTQHEKAGNA